MVVEDNASDVDLLKLAMKNEGLECKLTVVEDGGDALDLVRQRGKYGGVPPPDLMLLDLSLPKNDGPEILEALRANPVFADLKVAMLSSSSSPGIAPGLTSSTSADSSPSQPIWTNI